MTFPLMALAVGAIVAGFVGIPAAIGGGNSIEGFLEPSFTAQAAAAAPGTEGAGTPELRIRLQAAGEREPETPTVSRAEEIGLMGFSVLIAVIGIWLAHKFYVASPEISEQLAERWAGAHRTLSNKYYVDELYDATVISGTYASARGFWSFDRNVVDGVVNGTGWVTIISSWFSGITDKHVVDGVVNFVGRVIEEGSFWFRKLQTGLVQNYALWMLAGIFAFVSIYLVLR
jgi:NADH-quinone oxidoreductase subunit L